MCLPRPRLTVGFLMVFVALTAIALSMSVASERARQYRNNAKQYAKMEQQHAKILSTWKTMIMSRVELINGLSPDLKTREQSLQRETRFLARLRERVSETEATVAYYASLKTAYKRAALRPWNGPPTVLPPPSAELRVTFWLSRQDFGHALADLDELIRQTPDVSDPYRKKAWILATCPEASVRNGKRAVQLATRACELAEWKDPAVLDTLAAAYAEAGDCSAAIRWQAEAVDRAAPNSPDQQAFRARLALYRQGKPYRERHKAE